MSNEIKVGDKVRVREDAPRMYLRTMSTKFLGAECGVFEIIDGNAAIASGRDYIAIPLKYLIKVEYEAKEPKFKVGDKVVSKPPFVEKVWTVFGYDDKMPYMVMVGDGEYINERNLEPYTEPTERTEAEEDVKKAVRDAVDGIAEIALRKAIEAINAPESEGYLVTASSDIPKAYAVWRKVQASGKYYGCYRIDYGIAYILVKMFDSENAEENLKNATELCDKLND